MSLKLDFFESGIGETILITFPDGRLGIVDAHPSAGGVLEVLDHIASGPVEFVCLTHPHEDHGRGLVDVLKNFEVGSFWHTCSGIQAFVFSTGEIDTFPSYIQETVDEFMKGSGRFLLGIYGTVAQRKLDVKTLHSGLRPFEIGGVKIHVIGPEESTINRFHQAYLQIAARKRKSIPDPNLISAILVLEYGGVAIVLGGDAMIAGWRTALEHYRKSHFPKARLLKIPHHGASNAFDLKEKDPATYLGMCDAGALGVLFAGDSSHPEPRVWSRLEKKLDLACLINGKKCHQNGLVNLDPLNLGIVGARARVPMTPCQGRISVEISATGEFSHAASVSCASCHHSKV